ncbi:MAG: 50S ribosomal protein L9 [Lachnospiraceae bacterium]|nr:50S ribosomal protein L9 [Lachnospiraceae bacterium]
MKVILLQDVAPHGKKGEIIEVADSFGKNVLIRKKQALEATPKNLNDVKLQNRHKEKVAKENLADAQEMAKKMEKWKIETRVKAGVEGKVFGSVSSKEIANAIRNQYDEVVDKKKILLDEPIKSLGVHEVKVRLHPDVTATLRVHVVEK